MKLIPSARPLTPALSDEFRSGVNTLISGSGRVSAFWEYTNDTSNELAHYMLELALRRVGSNFAGRFYIKTAGHNPGGVADRTNDEVGIKSTELLQLLQFNLRQTIRCRLQLTL